jgi:hypothetical protein
MDPFLGMEATEREEMGYTLLLAHGTSCGVSGEISCQEVTHSHIEGAMAIAIPGERRSAGCRRSGELGSAECMDETEYGISGAVPWLS